MNFLIDAVRELFIFSLLLSHDQWDRIVRFFKFLVKNFLAKVAKIFGAFLAYFEKLLFEVKTAVVTFWATFENIGLLFILTSGHTAHD